MPVRQIINSKKRKMKRKTIIRYIILPIILILSVAVIYIYKEYNRTHKDTLKLKPDYSITASAFLKEFESNENESNKKYWDKVIQVKGIIKEIVKDDRGFYSIVLGDTSKLSSVRCSIDSSHNTTIKSVNLGEEVALKGICTGYNADELLGSDIILVRSVIDNKK